MPFAITPFRIVLVLALCAAVAFAWSRQQERKHDEARYAAIAGQIARREVQIRCPNTFQRLTNVSAEAGMAYFDANGKPLGYADLAPETCDGLREFTRADGDFDERTAWAVQTLAHEAIHLSGIRDEAVTECYGLQWTAFVAERLGASPERAHAVARTALGTGYRQLPEEYQSMECRDGGELDLRPATSRWP